MGGAEDAPTSSGRKAHASRSWRGEGERASADGALDMQVSFASGLGGLGSAPAQGKKAKHSKDLFQGYMRAKSDRKQAQRDKGRVHVDSDTGSEDLGEHDTDADTQRKGKGKQAGGDDPFDDPFFQVCHSAPAQLLALWPF